MPSQPVDRRLAAILAADVVGYSRLMGLDEEGTLQRMKAHLREAVEPKIVEHRGRTFKTMGDGFLSEFHSVVDAVRCAVEIQRSMAFRSAAEPEDRRIAFRMGINLGDVIAEDGDVFGDGVNVAARLQTLAEPGGICVSLTVRDHVQDKLSFAFEDMGDQAVKNITRPVHVLRVVLDADAPPLRTFPKPSEARAVRRRAPIAFAAVVLAAAIGAGAWWALAPRPPPVPVGAPGPQVDRPSIAVLPLVNLTGDSKQDYLTDGLTEDIVTELGQVAGLFVAPHEATARYRSDSVDPKDVARELGLRYVMQGSLRRAGDALRVTTALVNAETGANAWADHYDAPMEQAFAQQDALTETITTRVMVQIRQEELERARRKPAQALDPYDYYLFGKDSLARDSLRDVDAARAMFQKALDRDANYAPAIAGMAIVYFRDFYLRRGDLAGEAALDRVFDTAQKSLGIEPNVSEASYAVADVYLFRRHHDEAAQLLERVIARTADDIDLHERLGDVYVFAGEPQKGLDELLRVLRLNPYHQQVLFAPLARAYLLLDRLEDAILEAETCMARAADYRPCYEVAAIAYAEKDLMEKARSAASRIHELDPAYTLKTAPETLPLKHDRDLERFLAGLRKAGVE